MTAPARSYAGFMKRMESTARCRMDTDLEYSHGPTLYRHPIVHSHQGFSNFSLHRANSRDTDATAGYELPELANNWITEYDRYTALLRSFEKKTRLSKG